MATENEEMPADVQELHPVVLHVTANLIEGGSEPFTLSAEVIEEIRAGMDDVLKYDELREVVLSLMGMAYQLETAHNSPTAAQALIDIVESDKIVGALTELNSKEPLPSVEEIARAAQESAQQFKDFTGAPGLKAPMEGESAPEGSVTLDKFNIPRRG